MRRYMIGIAVVAAALAFASAAHGQATHTLDASITKTKLDKKKDKSVGLFIDIKTGPNTGAVQNADQPPTPIRTVVDFPKNLKFDTEAVPKCQGTTDELQNTSTAQATEICGAASIIGVPGRSSSTVVADLNPFVADPVATARIPVVVTAFNGTEPGQIIFHAQAESVNTTTVLIEQLKKSGDPKYGTSLITDVPPIAVGAPEDFQATIAKGTIVSAVCKKKTNPFRVTSTFTNSPTLSDTTSTTCSQKKGKKGGKG